MKKIRTIILIIPIAAWIMLGIAVTLFFNINGNCNNTADDVLGSGLNGMIIGGMINACIIGLLHSVSTMWQLRALPSGKIFSDKLLRYASIGVATTANISFYYCIFILLFGTSNIVQNSHFFRTTAFFWLPE